MATFTWYIQGTSNTTVDATDKIQFAGASFGTAISVGAYNQSTHVQDSGGANKSSGNAPKNSKYLTSSTVDLGSGSVSVSTATSTDAPLKINFSHATSVTTSGAVFYAYDGTTTTSAPTEVTFYCAEIGDSTWTNAEGSASAMTLDDNTTATSHDYFLLVSASPETVGQKTAFRMRIELIYS